MQSNILPWIQKSDQKTACLDLTIQVISNEIDSLFPSFTFFQFKHFTLCVKMLNNWNISAKTVDYTYCRLTPTKTFVNLIKNELYALENCVISRFLLVPCGMYYLQGRWNSKMWSGGGRLIASIPLWFWLKYWQRLFH